MYQLQTYLLQLQLYISRKMTRVNHILNIYRTIGVIPVKWAPIENNAK